MKVEFYEETTVQKKQRFIADDGTIFDSEGDCIAYEDRRKLDDMPYPATISVPILDFKKLLTEYEDQPKSHDWDLFGMEQPTNYPCLYTYVVDGANLYVSSLTRSPAQLIQAYEEVALNLSTWCAQQLAATL